MQFHRQTILIELYDIEIQFGGVEEMRQEDYVRSKLDEGSKVTAMTWMDNGVIKLAYSDSLNLKVLAHEIVHIVNLIFRTKGIQLDLNNDEPQAYLTGWLTQELHQRIFNY